MKKEKNNLICIMRGFIKKQGFKIIEKRVISAMDKLVYEDLVFLTETHQDIFYYHFCKNSKDGAIPAGDIATMYLLSVSPIFAGLLSEYIKKKTFNLPTAIKEISGECEYNIFHAVRLINGLESKLNMDDLFEKGIVDDRILCLVMYALLIKEYGFPECTDKKEIRKREISQRINSNTYEYKNQLVKISY